MSVFSPSWIPWNNWGHLLFWVILAAMVEVVTHNIMRAYRART